MLEVGNGMNVNEDRAHFTIWCMLAAPLISRNDLRHMSPETLQILTDKDVLAVNQDSLGVEGFVYSTNDNVEVWFKSLSGDSWAMCVLNRNKDTKKFSFDWKNEKVADSFSKRDAHFDTTTYSLRNLWTKASAGDTGKVLKTEVPGHDVLMLRLKAN